MYPQQPQYPQAPPSAPPPYAPPPTQPQPYPAPPQYPPTPSPTYPAPPPAQQYPPQYGQPPQGYAPQGFAPAPPPAIPGTLDQFYSQPSTGGGKALSFEAMGQTYTGIVSRPIGDGDISQQTDTQGRPQFFRDGRPKFVMKVPLQIQPSPTYPDGIAQWYVKGASRDELVRAMAEAGAPDGPPEAGSIITITMTGTRPSGPGMNPTKLVRVEYRRPQGSANRTATSTAAPTANASYATPAAPAPLSAPVMSTATGTPVTHQQQVPAPTPAPATPPPPPTSTYQPAPPPVYAVNTANGNGGNGSHVAAPAAPAPVELSPEQQALLAQLTGQPTA